MRNSRRAGAGRRLECASLALVLAGLAMSAAAMAQSAEVKVSAQLQQTAAASADRERVAAQAAAVAEATLVERRQLLRAIESVRARQAGEVAVKPPVGPQVVVVPAAEAVRLRRLALSCPDCKVEEISRGVSLAEIFDPAGKVEARAPSDYVVTFPLDRRDVSAALASGCPTCASLDGTPGGGGYMVYSTVDPGGWTPGGAPGGDACALPLDLQMALLAIDASIRSTLAMAPSATDLTVERYASEAPGDCPRNLLLYRLSVLMQLLPRSAS